MQSQGCSIDFTILIDLLVFNYLTKSVINFSTFYNLKAIAGRLVKGGLHIIPYNEIYVRDGGVGRIVDGKDCSIEETSNEQDDRASDNSGRTFNNGLGKCKKVF